MQYQVIQILMAYILINTFNEVSVASQDIAIKTEGIHKHSSG